MGGSEPLKSLGIGPFLRHARYWLPRWRMTSQNKMLR
jgi:hypothetical protein